MKCGCGVSALKLKIRPNLMLNLPLWPPDDRSLKGTLIVLLCCTLKRIQLIISIAERDRFDHPVSNCMCYYFDAL